MSGTVNISRQIWTDGAFKSEPFTEREAFMWLIMEASWKPRTKRVGTVIIDLCRGQLAASVRFMADAWRWTKSRVDRYLKRLEKLNLICSKTGTGVNVISVMKYDTYQNKPKAVGTAAGQQRDSSGTNYNKGVIPDAIKEVEIDLGFAGFWAIWPNKVAKQSAAKAWGKLPISDRSEAMEKTSTWLRGWRAQNPQAAHIHAATYLNQKRWQDEASTNPQQMDEVARWRKIAGNT